jgi:RimJ/RimL family protein N-acetyltransferase/8-oxo-dGTP pyrophosphatase MutT (NUDIX family)
MFNIRVYGILINDHNQVLVSDEYIRGGYYTKFPGGGLELGEGTRDCLEREFMEEMNLRVEVGEHLYTTDYFQQSAFNPEHQIISIYYKVKALDPIKIPLRDKPFDFDAAQLAVYAQKKETETFRFINADDFSEESVTLPIDKIVAGLIKQKLRKDFTANNLILENEYVRLEPLSQTHYSTLWEIAKDKRLWELTSTRINNETEFASYFHTAIKDRIKGIAYPFAVFDKIRNQYAGSTRYGNIDLANKKLEIGWTWYGAAFQGTGLNKQVKFLLLSYGFDVLGLHRIELKTSSLNLRSQAAMRKIGAKEEGTLRRHMINSDGSKRDSVYFSFISDEWEEIKQRIFNGMRFGESLL